MLALLFIQSREQARTLSILLSHRFPMDTIFKDLEKDGKYSVRSAYRAIFGDYFSVVQSIDFLSASCLEKNLEHDAYRAMFGGCVSFNLFYYGESN